MYKHIIGAIALAILLMGCHTKDSNLIYQSTEFSVYRDHVTEGKYTARALSRKELVSDYVSPGELFKSPEVAFKFSINGNDNASPSGKDCRIICAGGGGNYETPVIAFGEQYIDSSRVPADSYLQKDTRLTIRVDMNEVLKSFKEKGYYVCFNGEKIYSSDFNGVFVAGSVPPLTWDFNNLHAHKELQMHDEDGDGIYEIRLVLNLHPDAQKTASSWKLSEDISMFPRYHSPDILPDALYNLALSEMRQAVEPDSTFRTGKEWAGVWTRDISYSIILSMAVLQPKVAIISLKRKVKNGQIIQDTGTGGAYPVSSDRMVWAIAAWEVYKVTGDKNWLEYAYAVIKKSAAADEHNVYDAETGLVRGESSFLDWREQTYPVWMQPADIYASECLGTNAVHYEANVVLSEMALLLDLPEEAKKYQAISSKIKSGINRYLWQEDKGFYGQYLYGRVNKVLSPRSEALGEALTILFGIADREQRQKIVSHTPVTPYGITCIYPQIPGIPPYHNNAVWPFVESFWALASAKACNERSVVRAISAVYRPAALFLTNKENFVAANGDYAGTQINSSNMLWSLSGSISIVYKLLFGMQFHVNGLSFHPFVPKVFSGMRSLMGFKYRKAILNIKMKGYGNRIKAFYVDGKKQVTPQINSELQGTHSIKIVLANNTIQPQDINAMAVTFSPSMPKVHKGHGRISWHDTSRHIEKYKIMRNGVLWKETRNTSIAFEDKQFNNWQVIAVGKYGLESFASEPLWTYPKQIERIIQLEDFNPRSGKKYQGFSGSGFVETSLSINRHIDFSVDIPQTGTYIMDIRYANGNGPVNTENKCAVRTLMEGSQSLGTFVFPQRGKDEWSNWGRSNAIQIKLAKGIHHFSIRYLPFNANMNEEVNQAMLDCLRIIRVGG